MGLFSNKKKPCPICGSPTPRLFPDAVEGMPICSDCAGRKKFIPKEKQEEMTLEDLRQYIAFYEANQPLRDVYHEDCEINCDGWNDTMSIDTEHRLFRLRIEKDALVMEGACLKAFRILENDKPLFESSPEGLKCYSSDVPDRARALEPAIAQFRTQYAQYEYFQEMEKRLREADKSTASVPYMSRPEFREEVITGGFIIELTIAHPYWDGVHNREVGAPQFDDTYPSVEGFLNKYRKKTEKLHAVAVGLMSLIDPAAPEIQVAPAAAPAPGAAAQAAPVADPVAEIEKYKALLDSGAITEEEFTAKKRQILGI